MFHTILLDQIKVRLTSMYKLNKVYIKTTMMSKHNNVNTMNEWWLEYWLWLTYQNMTIYYKI